MFLTHCGVIIAKDLDMAKIPAKGLPPVPLVARWVIPIPTVAMNGNVLTVQERTQPPVRSARSGR